MGKDGTFDKVVKFATDFDQVGKEATFSLQHKTFIGFLVTASLFIVLLAWGFFEMYREFNLPFEYSFNEYNLPSEQINVFPFREENFVTGVAFTKEGTSQIVDIDPSYGRIFVLNQDKLNYPMQNCFPDQAVTPKPTEL